MVFVLCTVHVNLLAVLTAVLRLPAFFIMESCLLFGSQSTLFQHLVTLTAFSLAAAMALSQRAHLFLVYRSLAAVFLLVSAKYVMDSAVDAMETNNAVQVVKTFAICYFLGQLAAYFLEVQMSNLSFLILYSLPIITRYLVLHFPGGQHLQCLADGLSICHFVHFAMSALNSGTWRPTKEFNLRNVLVKISELHSDVTTISDQLVLFWLVSFTYNVLYYTSQTTDDQFLSRVDWVTFLCACAGECCRTPVGLVATCVSVFYAFRYVWGHGDQFYDWLEGHELIVLLICISFGNLALTQTTNRHLDLEHAAFITKMTILYTAAIFLNCLSKTVDPESRSSSALHTTTPSKHIRELLIYIFLAAFSLFIVYAMSQMMSISATFPVTLLCLSTSLHVLAFVFIYALNLWEGTRSASDEDQHDLPSDDDQHDVIFYIKSVVRTLDFLGFAILACTEMSVMITQEKSWILTALLIVKCYSYVSERLQKGWKCFLLRWYANKKMDSLKTASESEISAHEDDCPICLEPMSSAKVTPCHHFFHRECLKGWLVQQDKCPLCSRGLNSSNNTCNF